MILALLTDHKLDSNHCCIHFEIKNGRLESNQPLPLWDYSLIKPNNLTDHIKIPYTVGYNIFACILFLQISRFQLYLENKMQANENITKNDKGKKTIRENKMC